MDLTFLGVAPSTLPAIVALLPAVLGILALPLGRRAVPTIPLIAAGTMLPLVLLLCLAVIGSPWQIVALGGWQPPLGIGLRLDGLAVSFLLLTAVVATAVVAYGLAIYGRDDGGESRVTFTFWPLFFLLWTGLNTVFLSHDLFNLYVALEVTSLSGVALVAMHGGAAALVAQMRYLLFATFGSLLYLMGVALIYAEVGALDLGTVAERLVPGAPANAALSLITVGLLLKTAVWPLHFWLPPAHSSAPPPVSALLSGLVVKASLYLLIRLWIEVFAPLLGSAAWTALGVLGAVAVLWGSFLALRQKRLKLMIAYSTVAQLGYMLFLFPLFAKGGLIAVQAWTGGLLQIISHGLAKAGMFLAAGALLAALGGDTRKDLYGATRLAPLPVFALALAGLSIIALPPSGGFLAKWLLLRAAITAEAWWLAIVLVLGGLLAAAYLFRFLICAFHPVPEDRSPAQPPTRALGGSAMALALLSLLLGLGADSLITLIEMAMPTSLGELS